MSQIPPIPPPPPDPKFTASSGMMPGFTQGAVTWNSPQPVYIPNRSIWGIRIGSYLIDYAVCGLISYVIFFLLIASSIASIASVKHPVAGLFAVGWIVFLVIAEILLPFVYGTLCIGVWGRTLGMLMVGTRVVDVSTGMAIGFGRAFARTLVFYILFLPCFIPGVINLFSPLWDAAGQAWHDKAARSRVVIQP